MPVKWGFRWLAQRSGSLESGQPTPFMMTVTLLLVFASAFFTDVIGVHAIFGGFIAGLVIPRDNGFAISLLEKIEDIVSILFLPLVRVAAIAQACCKLIPRSTVLHALGSQD